jgi:hypothetical protein
MSRNCPPLVNSTTEAPEGNAGAALRLALWEGAQMRIH